MARSEVGHPSDDLSSFGGRVRAARIRAGFSQVELAAAAGLSPDAITAWERGVVKCPQARSLRKLSGTLRVSIAWLLDGSAVVVGGPAPQVGAAPTSSPNGPPPEGTTRDEGV